MPSASLAHGTANNAWELLPVLTLKVLERERAATQHDLGLLVPHRIDTAGAREGLVAPEQEVEHATCIVRGLVGAQ